VGGYYKPLFGSFSPFNIKHLELCFFSLSFSIFALYEGKRGPGFPFQPSLVNQTHISSPHSGGDSKYLELVSKYV
jgi:hypothetical protein